MKRFARVSKRAVLALGFLFVLSITLAPMAGHVHAQSTFGSLRGLTLDATGSAVPAVHINVHGLDDNTDHEVTSGDEGVFEVENLKPERYRVIGHVLGFADAVVPELKLEARQDLRITLTFAVASQTQTVEVSAAAEQINTENGTIAASLQNQQLTELPLNSRAVSTSPLGALALSPAVQYDSQGNISVGGATASMVGYSVDGISTANVRQNGALQDAYPSSEGIEELKITAFNNNAEFAQIGDVTFTTKSGTNQFRGSLFEYLQNDAFDAKPLNFSEKAPKRFNTFGGSLGGPVEIPKFFDGGDKTFFFFDYEGNRRSLSTTEQYLVPTAAEKNGDLNGFITANNPMPFTNPATGQPSAVLLDPLTHQQFMGCNGTQPNVICNTGTGNRISSVTQKLLNYYPLPNANLEVANPPFNYETLVPTPADTNGWDVRLDRSITTKQQIFARFSWKNLLTDVANPLLPNDVDSEHNRSLLVSYNYAISPKWINESRFGFTNAITNANFPILGSAAISQLGLQGIDISQHPDGEAFPTFNFSDGSGFTPIGRDRAGITQSKTLEFTDNLTRQMGKHTLRFGADIRRVNYQDLMFFEPSDDYGLFTFNQGVFTGSAFGDALLGLPNTSFFAITSPQVNARAFQYGIYGQDEWQVHDRLTVNFGLRWELLPPFTEAVGDLGSFDPRNNSILVPDALQKTLANSSAYQQVYMGFLESFNACSLKQGGPCSNVSTASQDHLPQGLRQLYKRDFDPRISVAFRPFRDNKTVFRAGFGIFTVSTLGPLSFNNAGNPLSVVHTYANNVSGEPQFQFPATAPPTQVIVYGGGTLDQANDPLFRDAQAAQWNLTIERQITKGTLLRASYVGMNSYRLAVTEDLNQVYPSTTPYAPSNTPYPNWFTLLSTENAGFANYQAVQVETSHQMAKGIFFQGNYTLAKNLSDAQGDAPSGFSSEVAYGLAVSNRFDLRANRGNVEGTPRHRFQLNGIYQLPFGSGRRWLNESRWQNLLIGGWEASTVTLLQTGPWLTPIISPTLDQSNTDIANRGTWLRPDCVGNPIPANRTAAAYFNINAFAPTPAGAGRIGDCGVGILEGPGTIAVSAGLGKTFPIHERLRLRFESTFTNVLNHTNYAPPSVDVSNPQTFGALESNQTSANAGPRTGQLALRLDF
jgi:Carboxypeptidase regulatory-like domain/TonB dependent receptor